MRIVIDSNEMQSDELRAFLALSIENKAVLTDYAAMEAFKGSTLKSIQASWTVLRDFPDQIVALKGTRTAALVDPRSAGMAQRMVSKPETQAVPDFAALLDRAAAGDRGVEAQLLQRGRWANDHMSAMLAKADGMNFSIGEFRDVFSAAELERMRRDQAWKPETGAKFLALVDQLSECAFKAHPDKPVKPHIKHRFNHFLYRHTLTYLVYMMQLIKAGANSRKAVRARNDAVDVIFATYATYFNGLMTSDKLASAVHHIARGMLVQLGARVPEDYLDSYVYKIADQTDEGSN